MALSYPPIVPHVLPMYGYPVYQTETKNEIRDYCTSTSEQP